MLTQVLQIRLREIAFRKIFNIKAIPTIHYMDKNSLNKELDDLGFITHDGKTEYRIFLEYFSAEYLLFGLVRDPSDVYYQQVMRIFKDHHNDKRYEQVWRILGEMLRFGNSFLDKKALGDDCDIFEAMPEQFTDNDLIGAYRAFFKCCLNGKDFNHYYSASSINFLPVPPPILTTETVTPDDFITTHKNRLNSLQEGDLATWLRSSGKSNVDLTRSLANLQTLVYTQGWKKYAFDKRWDENSFFQMLRSTPTKQYLVTTAYFICRLENLNYGFHYRRIDQSVCNTFYVLSESNFEDNVSRAFFLMAVQFWLKQDYFSSASHQPRGIQRIIEHGWKCIKENNQFAWLGVRVIFQLAFILRATIALKKSNNSIFLRIEEIISKDPKFIIDLEPIPIDKEHFIKCEFKKLRAESDFSQMLEPKLEWNDPEKRVSQAALVTAVGSPIHHPLPAIIAPPIPQLPNAFPALGKN